MVSYLGDSVILNISLKGVKRRIEAEKPSGFDYPMIWMMLIKGDGGIIF